MQIKVIVCFYPKYCNFVHLWQWVIMLSICNIIVFSIQHLCFYNTKSLNIELNRLAWSIFLSKRDNMVYSASSMIYSKKWYTILSLTLNAMSCMNCGYGESQLLAFLIPDLIFVSINFIYPNLTFISEINNKNTLIY